MMTPCTSPDGNSITNASVPVRRPSALSATANATNRVSPTTPDDEFASRVRQRMASASASTGQAKLAVSEETSPLLEEAASPPPHPSLFVNAVHPEVNVQTNPLSPQPHPIRPTTILYSTGAAGGGLSSTQLLDPVYPWDLEEEEDDGVVVSTRGRGRGRGEEEEFQHPSLENRKNCH